MAPAADAEDPRFCVVCGAMLKLDAEKGVAVCLRDGFQRPLDGTFARAVAMWLVVRGRPARPQPRRRAAAPPPPPPPPRGSGGSRA